MGADMDKPISFVEHAAAGAPGVRRTPCGRGMDPGRGNGLGGRQA